MHPEPLCNHPVGLALCLFCSPESILSPPGALCSQPLSKAPQPRSSFGAPPAVPKAPVYGVGLGSSNRAGYGVGFGPQGLRRFAQERAYKSWSCFLVMSSAKRLDLSRGVFRSSRWSQDALSPVDGVCKAFVLLHVLRAPLG